MTMSVAMRVVAVLALIQLSTATQYTVGDQNGWRGGVNFAQWSQSQNFKKDDTLLFPYQQGMHNVVEVSKAEYDSCTANNPMATWTDGNTIVSLNSSASERYFICSFPGHCSGGGMKLAVTVASASLSTAPSPTPVATSPALAPTAEATAPAPAPRRSGRAPSPSKSSPPISSPPPSVESPPPSRELSPAPSTFAASPPTRTPSASEPAQAPAPSGAGKTMATAATAFAMAAAVVFA